MKRKGLAALVALSFVLLVAGVLVYLRSGEIARVRAERLLRDRYGLDAEVRAASVSTSGVELRDVLLRVHGLEGSEVRISVVEVVGRPWELASRRLAGARAIRLEGVELVAVLDDAAVSLLRERRSRDAASNSGVPSGATSRPPVSVDGFSVVLLDEQGSLFRAEGESASMDAESASMRLATVELGDAATDHLDAASIDVALVRAPKLRLSRFVAQRVAVHWAAPVADLDLATEVRLVSRLRGAARRVRALREGSEETTATSGSSRLDRFTSRDFEARIEQASLATGEGSSRNLLAMHGLGLTRIDAHRVALIGEGSGEAGVTASFSMRVDPDAPSAEGSVRVTRVPLSLVGPFVPEIPWESSLPGFVSADVELVARDLEAISVRGSLDVEGAAFDTRRLASTPIRDLAFHLEGSGTLYPSARRFELGRARLGSGGVLFSWEGVATFGPDVQRIDGTLSLPETACDRAVHAIPADVLGPLVAFQLGGTIAGSLALSVDLARLDATRFDVTVDDRCAFESWPDEVSVDRFEAPFLHEVLEPDGSTFSMETGPGTSAWTPYGRIAPILVEAVLAHEDGAFFTHSGFAPWAIRDAIVRNLRERRYVVGASTISMQLAKNLFLHREKTLIRKVQEVLLTWWLERSLDKERILELYLNVIEYGPSVYGVRAASQYYFGCTPAELSPVAAAFLATILPAPKSYGVPPSGELSPRMRARLETFLRHMASRHRMDDATLGAALEELARFRFRSGAGAGVGAVVPERDVPDEDEGTSFGDYPSP